MKRNLSKLFSEAAPPEDALPSPTAPERKAGNAALNRMRAIEESTSAVPTFRMEIDPDDCSIWGDNARDYAKLTEDGCRDLIDSIRTDGVSHNRTPTLIRRVQGQAKPYELLVGTRRHWSVSWLRRNGYPRVKLLVEVVDVLDEEAYRLADIENRERQDVLPLERARNYRMALDKYYGGTRSRMAERLNIPPQTLSRLLKLAELPDGVIAAFSRPDEVTIMVGEQLARLLEANMHRPALLAAAEDLALEQAARRGDGRPALTSKQVLATLQNATRARKTARKKGERNLTARGGLSVAQVTALRRSKSVTLKIEPDPTLSVDEILEALRPAVELTRRAPGRREDD